MQPDIDIARQTKLLPISDIAKKLNISDDELEFYGKYKAKIVCAEQNNHVGKLVLVTAINPTPYGEGKTTVSIGLADGLSMIGQKACLALREPSLGPVFGVKGGATGGGYAQVVPMEDINLHFTGDFHAITSANNLLSALIDNHINQGNLLNIDIKRVEWKRALDLNDRALRNIEVALGGTINGVPRADGFNITAASEIMAILCLSTDIIDLKRRLGNIIIGYSKDGREIAAKDLSAENAMTILLKDAIKPNLVQTLEGTPCIMHGGPFANIAHGCNSIIATKLALQKADIVVTEAGFGAELGAEKFLDIKCRVADISPNAVVLVATTRSLKYNGGVAKADILAVNNHALTIGLDNLKGHIKNLTEVFGQNVVVAINKFYTDTDEELEIISDACIACGIPCVVTEGFAKGGKGAVELAKKVLQLCNQKTAKLQFAYPLNINIEDKIEAVAKKIYGAGSVSYSELAKNKIAELNQTGHRNLPICIAKTQYSFSGDATKLSRPIGFDFFIKDISLRSGSEFIVVVAGDILLMPGLPKVPASVNMTIDKDNKISGLF